MELERCIFCNKIIAEDGNIIKNCVNCNIRYCTFCNSSDIENPDLCGKCKDNLLNDMFSSKNK
jgi:hypothetical protein